MLDNSNFAGKKGVKIKKFLAYEIFCSVEINIKICILGTEFARKGDEVQCWLERKLIVATLNLIACHICSPHLALLS